MLRRSFIVLAASLVGAAATKAQTNFSAKLHKNPNCLCCDIYASHLEENGFFVELSDTTDLASVRRSAGVPEELAACHTMFLANYIVEGLVPAGIVLRMLKEQPQIAGIALPGMPTGVPGMPGMKLGTLTVYAFGPGGQMAFAEI